MALIECKSSPEVNEIYKNAIRAVNTTLINLLDDIFIPPSSFPVTFDKNNIIRLSFLRALIFWVGSVPIFTIEFGGGSLSFNQKDRRSVYSN